MRTVLLIEDDQQEAQRIENAIREIGLADDIHIVRTIERAQYVLQKFQYQAIVLDIDSLRLQELDQLTTLAASTYIPVVVIADDKTYIAAAIERGAKGYLLRGALTTRLQKVMTNAYSDYLRMKRLHDGINTVKEAVNSMYEKAMST